MTGPEMARSVAGTARHYWLGALCASAGIGDVDKLSESVWQRVLQILS